MKKLLFLLLAISCTATFPPVVNPPPPPPPAPSRMEMALNESGNTYWGVGRWNDASRSFSGWFFWDSTGTGKKGAISAFTANRYPLSDAQCLSFMNNYPAGDYTLTWEGKATIRIPWANKFVLTSPNSATVTLGANNQIGIFVTGLDPAHPLDHIHLWLPGQGPSSPMYRPEYVSNLKDLPITSLRTMGDQSTNATLTAEWNGRVTPDIWSWTDDEPPWEVEIELAKEAGLKRLWVNVPIHASDDYMLQMAKLFHSQMPVGVELMVELGNEIWNWGGGFNGWTWANQEGNSVGGVGHPELYDGKIVNNQVVPDSLDASGKPIFVTDQYSRAARAAATKAYRMAQIFHQVYQDRPADLGIIWAGQAGWSHWTEVGLQWMNAKYGAPGVMFKYSAIAPYFDYAWSNCKYCPTGGPKTVADLLSAADKMITTDLPVQIDTHKALANQYGLKLVDYEGGQSFFSWGVYSDTNIATLAQRDPGMGLLDDHYFKVLNDHGVNIHFEFAWVSQHYTRFGYWDILQNLTDTQAPRWQALKRYVQGP